ncbi:4-hydroxyphenylacetate 3-hydroxylase N-terminal domain-containing protein [Anaerobiospirillum thomasii]|uniref:4-hydroxyphenylacetate 3-hydroxylase N-terminal domain-containing protein n=1 Tax=Anaerobiospirillum thomasii TaxID=179995 RepID=UPI001C661D24
MFAYGKRVDDITTHPAFRNSAALIGRIYDALHDPQYKDVLCWETDAGSAVIPTSYSDMQEVRMK